MSVSLTLESQITPPDTQASGNIPRMPGYPGIVLADRPASQVKTPNFLITITQKPQLQDIPDQIINKILESVFLPQTTQSHCIRLVNKRLAAMALPHILRILSVYSSKHLLRIVSTPLNPLCHEHLGQYVRIFELAFLPENDELVEIVNHFPICMPKLVTVRLSFTLGIPIGKGEPDAIQALLSEDTLRRATCRGSAAPWIQFLCQMQPRQFEWISRDPEQLRLVGMDRDLRLLFASWKALSSVYLQGLCLVDQSDLTTWNLALLAERVHIKGQFHLSSLFFLTGFQKAKQSRRCQALLLEASPRAVEKSALGNGIPVLVFGNTVVILKGWSKEQRKRFRVQLGRSPEQISVHESSSRTNPAAKSDAPPKNLGIYLLLAFVVGSSVFAAALVRWHVHGSSKGGFKLHLQSSRPYGALGNLNHIQQDFYDGSWIRRKVVGDTWPLYHSAT